MPSTLIRSADNYTPTISSVSHVTGGVRVPLPILTKYRY